MTMATVMFVRIERSIKKDYVITVVKIAHKLITFVYS